MFSCMVKDSQGWGKPSRSAWRQQAPDFVKRSTGSPRAVPEGPGLVQVGATLTLGPQDSGHPLSNPPSDCASFSPSPISFLLPHLCTAAFSLDQQAKGCPSRGLRAHPGTFWHEMLQVCTGF